MAATSSGGHLGGSKDILSDRKYCREHTVIVNFMLETTLQLNLRISYTLFMRTVELAVYLHASQSQGICMKSQLTGKPLYSTF